MTNSIQIHTEDNVAVALCDLQAGETLAAASGITTAEPVARGHKIALREIAAGEHVIKYGFPIGHATKTIQPGEWVHVHNVKTNLSEEQEYTYQPAVQPLTPSTPQTFDGFLREDGRAGIRNELWIIPTVGCVNGVCKQLEKRGASLASGSIDGVYAFEHPFGCSQMGDDHASTRKLLAALVDHPNAGGVLVVGLGCENNTLEGFQQELGSWNDKRVKFMVCQDEADEFATGERLLQELADYAGTFARQPLPVSKLVVGMKCGGSDGLSGITANPMVGAFSDLLIAQGGSTVLTEVPEMFGAEGMLMNRCVTDEVFQKAADMVNSFKRYFIAHDQVVYENPSPGNKAGGITTLEDKSLGCVQKGGKAPVSDVIGYADKVVTPGLNLLSGPGNDLVSATALTAAGAHLILFTTGRGTPFGAPAPTVKVSTNNALAEKKPGWIDFNAGSVAEGESVSQAAVRLLDYVISLASGHVKTKTEENGYREISIFKDGVVL